MVEFGCRQCQSANKFRASGLDYWLKTGIILFASKADIPRADLLADITAKNPVSHLAAILNWNSPFVFDGQVRNAGAGVDSPVWQDAAGRASLDAAAAAPALVSEKGLVWFNFCGG
jgi:hypothetical protein